MTPLAPGAAKLLTRVVAKIRKEPSRFNMGHFAGHITDEKGYPCGTSACIAGWVVALHDRCSVEVLIPRDTDSIANRASTLLVGVPNSLAKADLFYSVNWPQQYRDPYMEASLCGDRVQRAEVAAQLLESVVKEGGVWWQVEDT